MFKGLVPIWNRARQEALAELKQSQESWALARAERREAAQVARRTMDALHNNHLRESVEFQLKGFGR